MLFVLIFFWHQMFLYNVSCVHHLDQIPILEEALDPFAYENPKSSRAMEPFCLWKIQRLRLRSLLYPGTKERRSCLVDLSSVVSINLVWSFFLVCGWCLCTWLGRPNTTCNGMGQSRLTPWLTTNMSTICLHKCASDPVRFYVGHCRFSFDAN